MQPFDKPIKLTFQLNHIESIQDALSLYQDLINQDKAFKNGINQVEFMKATPEGILPLQKSDGQTQELSNLTFSQNSHLQEESIPFNSNVSDAILFSHALSFPELLDQLVDIAESIVNYARAHGSTPLRQNDCCLFGIESLYLLAKKHPSYAYLLGSFLVPSDDLNLFSYAYLYPRELMKFYHWTAYTMKMFCYCDHPDVRYAMLGGIPQKHQISTLDLFEHFTRNPDNYEQFKDILVNRFRNQSFLASSNSINVEDPIHSFYKTILLSSKNLWKTSDLWSDNDHVIKDIFDEPFMSHSLSHESIMLTSRIKSVTGQKLV